MMRQLTAVTLSAALISTGCASAGGPRFQTAGPTQTAGRFQAQGSPVQTSRSTMLLSDYVMRLPVGSKVRVDLYEGRRVRGTLMKADAQSLVLRPRARIPEPPV